MSGEADWLRNASYVHAPLESISTAGYGELASKDEQPQKRKRKGGETKCATTDAKSKIFVKSLEDLAHGDGYQIDSAADSENLHYDSLYSGDISLYRRRFGVVGLTHDQWVELNDGRSKAKHKTKKEKSLRYFQSKSQAAICEIELTRPRVKAEEASQLDYLGLEVNRPADSAESLTVATLSSQLTGDYNKRLLNEPHNVELWLEFIALQDELGGWTQTEEERVGKMRRAVMDRKVAIFERALDSNPSSVELLTGYMELVREFWETEKIVRKWKDIVFHQPNKAQLWISYINFCQTSFTTFSTSSQLALYHKCISTLVSILSGSLQSHQPEPDAQDQLLNIIHLYCQFLLQAGHTEKAVACYQAIIEFNLCCPNELTQQNHRTRKEFFETFWDSGCRRFGEKGALGWHNWTAATQTSPAHTDPLGLVDVAMLLDKVAESADKAEDGIDPELVMISGMSLTAEAWLKLETHRTVEQCLPWRPDREKGEDEDDCMDPDRLVLFDDVSHTLVDISDASSRLKLVLQYLRLLGAPVADATRHTTATAVESLAQLPLDFIGDMSSLSEQKVDVLCSLSCDVLNTGSLTELGEVVGSHLLSPSSPTSVVSCPSVHNTIVNSINQALSLFTDTTAQTKLTQICMTYLLCRIKKSIIDKANPSKTTKVMIKAAQKFIKAILRLDRHRNNLSLWNCCALTEHLLGNCTEASRLYHTLLVQQPAASSQLACSYCECVLGMQPTLAGPLPSKRPEDLSSAIHVIVSLSEGQSSPHDGSAVSGARILRARTKFEQNFSRDIEISEMLCHCYLEYLTRGLEAACKVFDQWTAIRNSQLQSMQQNSSKSIMLRQTVENLFTKQVQLIEVHSRNHPSTPPVLMRSLLERALAVFPENRLFLAKFINSEQRSFISGRVRRFFDSKTGSSCSCIPWLYSVAAELQRYCHLIQARGTSNLVEETSLGTVNRLCAVLSRATESTSGQRCPLLWRMYMLTLVRNFDSLMTVLLNVQFNIGSYWKNQSY